MDRAPGSQAGDEDSGEKPRKPTVTKPRPELAEECRVVFRKNRSLRDLGAQVWSEPLVQG